MPTRTSPYNCTTLAPTPRRLVCPGGRELAGLFNEADITAEVRERLSDAQAWVERGFSVSSKSAPLRCISESDLRAERMD